MDIKRYQVMGTAGAFARHLLVGALVIAAMVGGMSAAWARETVTYYHLDALGSPIAATDAQGNVKWREDYQPYGSRLLNQDAASDNDRWYTGHPFDEAFGLTYTGTRYYDPVAGRFMGVDPKSVDAGDVHSFNRYAYADNNPYRYVDPDGQQVLVALGVWAGVEALTIYIEANSPPPPGCGDCVVPSAALSLPPLGAAAGAAAEGLGLGRAVIREGEGVVARESTQIVEGTVVKSAEARAKEIHSILDPRAQRARTTAVTETQEGVRVVSSSERRLTPAQRAQLGANEVEGAGVGHAEVTGVNAARDMGLTPTGTAASRPICPSCAGTLRDQGIDPLSPLK